MVRNSLPPNPNGFGGCLLERMMKSESIATRYILYLKLCKCKKKFQLFPNSRKPSFQILMRFIRKLRIGLFLRLGGRITTCIYPKANIAVAPSLQKVPQNLFIFSL